MLVVPGDKLEYQGFTPGRFTYTRDGCVYATVVGTVHCDQASNTISIQPKADYARSSIPQPGQLVYCQVTKVTPRFAGVDIIAIMSDQNTLKRLPCTHKATIRQQDTYSVEEREPAVVYDCFRPMDFVRAQVIGTGDSSSGLLLSTGLDPELGVVSAKSGQGHPLVPVAWNEMMCCTTGAIEKRKVARPRT
jgi:exosome complex component CSL4